MKAEKKIDKPLGGNRPKMSRQKQSGMSRAGRTKPLVGFFQGIGVRLIAAFLLPVLLLVALGFVSYNMAAELVVQNVTQSSRLMMKSRAEYLGLLMDNVDSSATQLLANDDLRTYLTTDDGAVRIMLSSRITTLVTAILNSNPYLEFITILNDPNSVNSPYLEPNPEQYLNLELVKRAVAAEGEGVWITDHAAIDAFMGPADDGMITAFYDPAKPQVFYARMLRRAKDAAYPGILVMALDAERVNDFLGSLLLTEDARAHFLGVDGYDVSHRHVPPGSEAAAVDPAAREAYEMFEAPFIKAYREDAEETSFYEEVNHQGVQYVALTEKLPDTGVLLTGMIPYDSLVSGARTILMLTIGFVLFAALVSILVGVFMATGMSRTITRIVTVSRQAAGGDLTVNPTSRRKDELGVLTRAISDMIASMRRLIERTATTANKVTDSVQVVSQSTVQVEQVSRDITTAISEIAQGATSQAQDSEQGVSKMNQLSQQMALVAQNTQEIETVTNDTVNLTQHGMTSVDELGRKVRETSQIIRSIVEDIQQLSESSGAIGGIVQVINGIADQTNLLALNAAIEAARAGESGRGFAVVAEEVRKLAEQSMKATREIGEIVDKTQEQTMETAKKANKTGEILKSQDLALEKSITSFSDIKTAMDSMVTRIQGIMRDVSAMDAVRQDTLLAIQNISAVSEETAASAQEVTASSDQQLQSIESMATFADNLAQEANELKDVIGQFKV
jgi:methyl-accepting chemotaxis protein